MCSMKDPITTRTGSNPMRSIPGLSTRIRRSNPTIALRRTRIWKIVPPLLLAMTIAPWLQSIPAQAQATPPTTIAENIVTDFRAKCDGVAPITLTIPSGSVCMFSNTTGSGNWFAKRIKNLLVLGYGATLSDNNGTGNGFFLGGIGVFRTISTARGWQQWWRAPRWARCKIAAKAQDLKSEIGR